MTAWIGADPGFTGALALYRGPQLIELEGMQVLAPDPIRGLPKRIDDRWLLTLLRDWSVFSPRACVERAQAMPRDGKDKIARYMCNFGMLLMAFSATGIPYHTTRPMVWKGMMGLSDDKSKSTKKFQEMFGFRPRRHDYAEAGLLAVYGSWYLEGKK